MQELAHQKDGGVIPVIGKDILTKLRNFDKLDCLKRLMKMNLKKTRKPKKDLTQTKKTEKPMMMTMEIRMMDLHEDQEE